jgi:hypothetical protein
MYIKSILKTGALTVATFALVLVACNKKSSTTTTTNTTTTLTSDDNGGYASDAAKLESASNDVVSIADAAATGGNSNLRETSTCATVSFDTLTSGAHSITIDFGTGCTGLDGKTRKGKIIVTFNGRYKDSASSHTITYNNYYVNSVQLTGSKTVTNQGRNSSGQYWYTVTVNDSLIFASDSIASWTGSRTRTWLAGYSTPSRLDDEYTIGGTTTVRRANGHTFTFTITTPLQVALSCPYIEAGVVNITSSTFTGTRTLDYGSGACDNNATLTIGSRSYPITLR